MMQLKVFMPFAAFADISGVLSMVVETTQGALGMLPNRLDCVAVLNAGILSYSNATEDEMFIAVDEGVLVKTGNTVLVSTRRAVAGNNLDTLHKLVEEEFLLQDELERNRHATMLKLETGFLRRFAMFQHET
ncbi:F0F1 ATP synthase subunit epsilon [Alishewanella tabrizica]|nr:F0F1 ATP synthase subunit epsilon [Alishewanella tabrizica]